MALVDEYDRAPMGLYASIRWDGLSMTEIKKTLNPVIGSLKNFLLTLKSLGASLLFLSDLLSEYQTPFSTTTKTSLTWGIIRS